MNKSPDRKALGKGLSSLLPPKAPPPDADIVPQELPIDLIDPNPLQPRTVFRTEAVEELAASIKANGIVQPLIVQKEGARYMLIAGERRLRAAKLAGLTKVPVAVRRFEADRVLEVALIENIQREDLNPIEVAQALQRLGMEYDLKHEELAERTGKDRSTITNLLRLLRLDHAVQTMVAEGRLSMGHARALLAVTDPYTQASLAEKAAKEGWSVRRIEEEVKKPAPDPKSKGKKDKQEPDVDPNVRAAQDSLERSLGTRVKIVERTSERGRIEIEYFSKAELQRIYELLSGE